MTIDADLPPTATADMVTGAAERILDNLISNALDATPPGGRISISLDTRLDMWELRVMDEGPGMSDAERLRAFDRFFSSGKPGRGSGLGLSIVRQLARSSGGDVTLNRSNAGGLDAAVTLPASQPARHSTA